MKRQCIGIIGGMGSRATVDLFHCIVATFSKKNLEIPHLIIDNYSTLPNKVRALLYNERKDELIEKLTNTVINLKKMGCTKIIFDCNVVHAFIPEIIKREPSLKSYLIDIIDLTVDAAAKTEKKCFILCSKNTQRVGVFDEYYNKNNIAFNYTTRYSEIEKIIDCLDKEVEAQIAYKMLCDVIEDIDKNITIILGCTELSILAPKLMKKFKEKEILDPNQILVNMLLKIC